MSLMFPQQQAFRGTHREPGSSCGAEIDDCGFDDLRQFRWLCPTLAAPHRRSAALKGANGGVRNGPMSGGCLRSFLTD